MRRSAAGERRKGKADKRAPLVSCPGRKVKGRCGDAGRLGWAALRGGIKGGEEKSWAGPCARGPVGCARVGFRPMVVKVIRV
jgi:hypothetical protein